MVVVVIVVVVVVLGVFLSQFGSVSSGGNCCPAKGARAHAARPSDGH